MFRSVLRPSWLWAALAASSILVPALAFAQSTASAKSKPALEGYDDQYAYYLEAARHTVQPQGQWFADLMLDAKARRLNDLVTVRVVESLSATGSANANVGKASSGTVSLPKPLASGVSKLLPTSSETKFTGAGATSRTADVTSILTARVSEVLPNGDLVVEGVREIEISGDRQVIVLTGVVRAIDVGPDNSVPSTAMGQLRIRCIGKGFIKDSLSPGWLIRVLNKIF